MGGALQNGIFVRLVLPAVAGAQYYRSIRSYDKGVVIILGTSRQFFWVDVTGQIIDSYVPPLSASVEAHEDISKIGIGIDGTVLLPYMHTATSTCSLGYVSFVQRGANNQTRVIDPSGDKGLCFLSLLALKTSPSGFVTVATRAGVNVQHLIRINNGQISSTQLDVNGLAQAEVSQIDVDTNGMIVLTRSGKFISTGKYQAHVMVYSSDGSWLSTTYIDTLPGEAGQAHYLSGVAGDVIVPGSAYVITAQTGWSSYQGEKLHRILIQGLSDQYFRHQLFVPYWQQRGGEPLNYVAIGDSFSSGEGVPPFSPETDVVSNQCHRSVTAYPMLLAHDMSLRLNLQDFRACSGATAQSLLGGQYDNGNQLDAINGDTDIVTVTIGGNDVEFGLFVKNCLTPGTGGCAVGTLSYSLVMQRIDQILPDQLALLFSRIQTRLLGNAHARVYVLGYPNIIQAGASKCNYALLGVDEQQAGQNIADALNAKILSAVNATFDSRIKYVAANGVFSPFFGHSICSLDPYFNGYDPLKPEIYTAHPDWNGQQAYASLVKEFMQGS